MYEISSPMYEMSLAANGYLPAPTLSDNLSLV